MSQARLGQPSGGPNVKRRLLTMTVEPKGLQEVEMPADSVLYGIDVSESGLVIILGVPEGAGPVRRKVWVVPSGHDVSVEGQNCEYLGHVKLLSTDGAVTLAVVFVETQKQAIERGAHRGGYRST